MELKRIFREKNNNPTIVVIGGGFAGINFVKSIKSQDCNVILVDKHNYHQFQPLLYQVAISGLEPDSIVSPIRKLFNQNKNIHFVMGQMIRINEKEKYVELDVGYLIYDKLVIATGSKTNFYRNQKVAQNSFGLKDINDALNIRSWMLQQLEKASLSPEDPSLTHFVVAGAGPAGIEMAGSLAEFCSKLLAKEYPNINKDLFKITILEGSGRLLGAMSERAQKSALKVIESLGIKVVLNAFVKDFDGNTVMYEESGISHRLEAQTLIWTAGVTCEKIEGLSPEIFTPQNRIMVNKNLQLKSCKDIYAIGDLAHFETKEFPRGLPMVAQTAIQQGHYLANTIFSDNPKPFVFKNKGSMATIGMKNAVADVNSILFQGKTGWLIWSMIHLISITSFKNRLAVGFSWMLKYLSYDKANQLIIRQIINPNSIK